MKKHYLLTAIAVASTTVFSTSKLFADSAAAIEGDASGTLVTYDNASGAYPIVTAILSVGGQTLNGFTYSASKYAFLAQDSTGSLDVFGALPAGSFTPTVGDGVSIAGTYSPFDGLAEIETITSATLESSGNTAPSAKLETIAGIGTGATLPEDLNGFLIQIDNITISGQTAGETFGIGDVAFTMNDGTGSMSLFYDPTSYSVSNQNLFGETIPTGLSDVTGVLEIFDNAPEFVPLDITPVPEPTTLSLCAVGGLLTLALRRRKS